MAASNGAFTTHQKDIQMVHHYQAYQTLPAPIVARLSRAKRQSQLIQQFCKLFDFVALLSPLSVLKNRFWIRAV
jgi:hypothetical protein